MLPENQLCFALYSTSLLTTLLERMDSAALITRIRKPLDERCVRFKLIATGRRLKSKASAIQGCVLSATRLKRIESLSFTQEINALRSRQKSRHDFL